MWPRARPGAGGARLAMWQEGCEAARQHALPRRAPPAVLPAAPQPHVGLSLESSRPRALSPPLEDQAGGVGVLGRGGWLCRAGLRSLWDRHSRTQSWPACLPPLRRPQGLMRDGFSTTRSDYLCLSCNTLTAVASGLALVNYLLVPSFLLTEKKLKVLVVCHFTSSLTTATGK